MPNPQDLFRKLWVNDVLKQDSNTAEMIFTLADQIAHLSRGMTLYPGDVILTGTPASARPRRPRHLQCRKSDQQQSPHNVSPAPPLPSPASFPSRPLCPPPP